MVINVKVQCIYYSASRTTQKVLDKVAEGTGMTVLSPIDLTNAKVRKSFDGKMDDPEIAQAFEQVLTFLRKHLKP